MPSVTEHYEKHLAPIYVWMAGGMDAALARGRAEVEALVPRPARTQWAVDLGAGFGMHAIPLADMGYSVLAIDSSDVLLDAMKRHVGTRTITIVRDDLLAFRRHVTTPAALIVCMGDTLTHLPDRQSVHRLFADVAEALEGGGTFVVTFRDYSKPLTGLMRFIPVRGDSERMLTCFLEYDEHGVTVHDIVTEREGTEWRQRISAYRKLGLSREWVAATLESKGLRVRIEQGLSGMTRLIGIRMPATDA
jgi:hypothetical protein